MTNEKDPFAQVENEFTPELPQVSKETVDSIVGEFVDNPNFIADTYLRMIAEQIPLTNQIANYISQSARDPQEAQRMAEVLVFTYRMLESQAQADTMAESLDVAIDDSSPE